MPPKKLPNTPLIVFFPSFSPLSPPLPLSAGVDKISSPKLSVVLAFSPPASPARYLTESSYNVVVVPEVVNVDAEVDAGIELPVLVSGRNEANVGC
jgi:hypothetical protein